MQKKSIILILAIVGYLIYFLSPIDLIPDVTGLFGKLDDFALLIYLIWLIRKLNKKEAASASRLQTGTKWMDSDDPYQILGISHEATPEEIRKAYEKLASEYHPKNFKNVSEEFLEQEEEKYNKIKWAYDELKKSYL